MNCHKTQIFSAQDTFACGGVNMAAVQFHRHCQAACSVMKSSQQTQHIPRNVISQLLECSNPCQLAAFMSQGAQQRLPLTATHHACHAENHNDAGTGKI